jgi:hypothetical protein
MTDRTLLAFALALLTACINEGPPADPLDGGASVQAEADVSEVDASPASARPDEVAADDLARLRMRGCDGGDVAYAGTCSGMLAGIYVIQAELDVWWGGSESAATAFDPGRGKITWLSRAALSERCHDGTAAMVMHPCALQLPPLYADASGSVLQLVASDALWEQPDIPSTDASVSVGAAAVSFGPRTSLLGIALAQPDAPWPSFAETPFVSCGDGMQGSACFPDHDRDGHPGITLHAERHGIAPEPGYTRPSGWQYGGAPIDPAQLFPRDGAHTLFLGLRTTLGGSYPSDARCNGGAGTATAAEVSLRVLDCARQDGTACTASEATYVDQSMPAFHVLTAGSTPPGAWKHPRAAADAQLDRSPSRGTQLTVLRLGDLEDSLTCADIRTAAHGGGH